MIEGISEVIQSVFDLSGQYFRSFADALRYLFEAGKKEKITVVLDEYPYARQMIEGLDSQIQALADEYKFSSSLKLVLSGSFIDIMNILACISVVCLHHNGLVHTYYDTPGWRQSLVVECVFYWAVPIFFMITGATLMNYREKYSTKEFFKKRFVRTVIPWLFWSAVTLIVNSNSTCWHLIRRHSEMHCQ